MASNRSGSDDAARQIPLMFFFISGHFKSNQPAGRGGFTLSQPGIVDAPRSPRPPSQVVPADSAE